MLMLSLSHGIAHAHQDPDLQLAEIEQLTVQFPHDVELLLQKGSLLLAETRLEEARNVLLLAEGLAPSDLRVLTNLGRVYLKMGWHREAEAIFDRVLDVDGAIPSIYFLRAQALRAQRMYPLALADFDRAMVASIQQSPTHFLLDACLSKVALLNELGQHQAAQKALTEARRYSSASAIDAAIVRIQLAHPTESGRGIALSVVNAQIERTSISTEWLLMKAELLMAAGQARAARDARFSALEDAQRSVSLRPTAAGLLWRARANFALEEFEVALGDAEQASRRAPRLAASRRLAQVIRAKLRSAEMGVLR